MFTVIVTEKGGAQQTLEFDEEAVSLGRVQGNEVVLPRGNVSKRHAKIEHRNGQFLVSDTGSTNGTYLNGRRIDKPTSIGTGDKLYIGSYIVSLAEQTLTGLGSAARKIGGNERGESPNEEPPYDSSVQVVSFLEDNNTLSKPDLSPVRDDEPEVGSVKMRPDSGPRRAPSMSLVPDRKSKDRNRTTDRDFSPPDFQGGPTRFEGFVEKIIDRVALEVKRVDRSVVPVKLDPGMAGQVRIIVDDLVDDLESRGKLPEEVNPQVLRGNAFRSIVDLGPLEAWLSDDEVKMIRIPGPGSAFLYRNGSWTQAADRFVTRDELNSTIRSLGAGLPSLDRAVGGTTWYRTEEGFRVFGSTLMGGGSRPSLFVDKTSAPSAARTQAAVPPPAKKAIEKAMGKNGNIAVIGAKASARMSLLESLVDLLPGDRFVVVLQKRSFSPVGEPHRLVLMNQNQNENTGKRERSAAFMDHALALEPDWIVAGGVETVDAPSVLRAGAGRTGVVAELPVCRTANLDQELALIMASSGAPLSLEETARLMSKAFHFVVTATRNRAGFSTIGSVHEGTLSLKGRFETKKLYDAASK